MTSRQHEHAWTGLVLLCKDVSTKGYGGQPLSADIVSIDIHGSDGQSQKTVYQLLSAALSDKEKERTLSTEADSRISWALLAKFDVFIRRDIKKQLYNTILFCLWQPPTADIHLDLSQRWLCQTRRQVLRGRGMQTNGCQSLTTFCRCFRRFWDDGMICEQMQIFQNRSNSACKAVLPQISHHNSSLSKSNCCVLSRRLVQDLVLLSAASPSIYCVFAKSTLIHRTTDYSERAMMLLRSLMFAIMLLSTQGWAI